MDALPATSDGCIACHPRVPMQLEEGNAALLHQATPVLELLAADAMAAEPAQAARALTALTAVLAADPTGGSAEALYRTSLPGRVLADLQEGPHRALTQVGRLLVSRQYAALSSQRPLPASAFSVALQQRRALHALHGPGSLPARAHACCYVSALVSDPCLLPPLAACSRRRMGRRYCWWRSRS